MVRFACHAPRPLPCSTGVGSLIPGRGAAVLQPKAHELRLPNNGNGDPTDPKPCTDPAQTHQ